MFLPSEVFICGGYNGEVILSDLWKINLQTFQWTKLPAVMPEPAYFHCATVTPVSEISFTHILISVQIYEWGKKYFTSFICCKVATNEYDHFNLWDDYFFHITYLA